MGNGTLCHDGKIRAIESKYIYDNAKLIKSVYDAELAKGLMELGYTLMPEEHKKRVSFEIDNEYYDHKITYSKRSVGIDARAKELKEVYPYKSDSELRKMACEELRKSKRLVPSEVIRQDWLSQKTATTYTPRNAKGYSDDEMFQNTIEYLTTNNFKLTKHAILDRVLQENMYMGVNLEYAERLIEQHLPSLVLKVDDEGKEFYTTKELAERHDYCIKRMTERGNATPFLTLQQTLEGIKGYEQQFNLTLTNGQREFITCTLTGKDKITNIQGDAGTGKTAAVDAIRYILEKYKVAKKEDFIGLSNTSNAAETLQEATGIQSQTIASFKLKPPQEPKIIFVDEAGTIATNSCYDLLKACPEDSRIIFVGDTKQLDPIEAGTPFKDVQKFKLDCELHEVIRQKTVESKKIVEYANEISHGDSRAVNKCFEYIKDKGLIVENENSDKLLEGIINNHNSETLISVTTKADKDAVNRLGHYMKASQTGAQEHIFNVREPLDSFRLAKNYKIGDKIYRNGMGHQTIIGIDESNNIVHCKGSNGKAHSFDPHRGDTALYRELERGFIVGERVRFLKNHDHNKYRNGYEGVIEAISSKGDMTVKLDNKSKAIKFNIKDYPYIEHAYANILHKEQGRTYKNVILYADNCSVKLFYTTATRTSHNLKVYTRDTEGLIRSIQRDEILSVDVPTRQVAKTTHIVKNSSLSNQPKKVKELEI
jgi:ATP-dependent exoDNAse (exonuclease V) alpha subunit